MNDILELDSIYESLYEYYINDYIIFEGILKRDYYEVIGILNENAVTNFFKGIWQKILNAFKWLRDKIKELLDKIFGKNNKEDSSSSDNKKMTIKEMIKKYDNYNEEDKDKLKELKISGFRVKESWHNFDINKILADYENIIDTNIIKNMDTHLEDQNYINNYSKIANINVSENLKKNKYSIYDLMFEKNDIEYPFKKVNLILYNKSIETFIDSHNKILNSCKKRIDNSIKYIELSIDSIRIKNEILDFSQQQKNAALMLKAVNVSSKMIIGVYGITIKYYKIIRKQFIRLLVKAINYLDGGTNI